LTFDLLTLKVVFESRVTWATSVPYLVFLGVSVLELGPMYATDRRQTKASLNASVLWGRRHKKLRMDLREIWLIMLYLGQVSYFWAPLSMRLVRLSQYLILYPSMFCLCSYQIWCDNLSRAEKVFMGRSSVHSSPGGGGRTQVVEIFLPYCHNLMQRNRNLAHYTMGKFLQHWPLAHAQDHCVGC